jgi:hypothetical protein
LQVKRCAKELKPEEAEDQKEILRAKGTYDKGEDCAPVRTRDAEGGLFCWKGQRDP